jgi:hypothetical protein
MLSKSHSSRLEGLASWLNLKVPQLADAQRDVRETIGLLRSRKCPPRARAALRRKFSKLPVQWEVLEIAGHVYVTNVIAEVEMVGLGALRDISWVSFSEVKELLEAGAVRVDPLKRLLECKRCRKWFVGRGEQQHKRFCSDDCREEFWSEQRKTPRGRKKEAERLRKWRIAERAKKSQGGKQS